MSIKGLPKLTELQQQALHLAQAHRPPEVLAPGVSQAAAEDELQDLTRRLRCREQELEAAYQEAQDQVLRYRELFEFAPDGYLVTDAFGVIEQANHAAATLLQQRKEFLIGKPLAIFTAGEQRAAFYHHLTELRRQARTASWEVRLQPRNSQPIDIAVSVSAMSDGAGALAGFRWLLRDVTEHRRLEKTLREERYFAESLLEVAQVLVLVLDSEDRVVRSNPALHAATGFAEAELAGRDWSVLLPAETDRVAVRTHLHQAARAPGKAGKLVEICTHDGDRRSVLWKACPQPTAGLGGNVMLIGLDVTELQEAQRKALQAERLAAVGQMMAGLAHEGRNALQRSQACLERLRWTLADRPEALDLVLRSQKAQDDLTRLFNDVRAYAAPLNLERIRCSLPEIWREAWEQVAVLFPGRDATLVEESNGVDMWCCVDRFRLMQVFRNILENAFAACAGPVRVGVTCQETALNGRPAVALAVRDNGPGLNADQRRQIFEPFYTTKVRGTGLGMAIAKRIVEAHGGQIDVGDAGLPGAEMLVLLPRDAG
jgi:two-component system sensor kinase FixL